MIGTFFTHRLSDEGGLAVNFNLHMDPAKGETSATEITEILTQEILSSNITGSVLGDLTIDPESLEIQGNELQFIFNIYNYFK